VAKSVVGLKVSGIFHGTHTMYSRPIFALLARKTRQKSEMSVTVNELSHNIVFFDHLCKINY